MSESSQRGLALTLFFVMLLGSIISVSSPTNAQMNEASGTSSRLEPGEVFSVNMTIEDSESLILWFWDANRNVSIMFWIETPDNSTYVFNSESYGIPQAYGLLARQTGIYTFCWQNGHDWLPVTIFFIIYTVLPRIQLISPASGSTVTSVEQEVHGICNGAAPLVEISRDNTSFVALKTKWDFINATTSWTANLSLSPGRNDFWIRVTYSSGDFTFTKSEYFYIYLDTLWFYDDHGKTKVGVGTITVLVLSVLALSGAVLLIRQKKRRGKT